MSNSKDYFDEIAPAWDNLRNQFFSEKVREVAYNLAKIEKGKTGADMGAGTGFITEGLLQKGIKVIAVDQSEEMLKQLKNHFSGHQELECIQGDGENLPIEDGKVDYAFANMFLHHIENPRIAIKEMTRILKPGGKLVITDLDEHDFEFLKTEQYDIWMGFKRDDLAEWFKDAGLANVYISCVGADCCSDSECGCDKAKVSIFAAYGEKV